MCIRPVLSISSRKEKLEREILQYQRRIRATQFIEIFEALGEIERRENPSNSGIIASLTFFGVGRGNNPTTITNIEGDITITITARPGPIVDVD